MASSTIQDEVDESASSHRPLAERLKHPFSHFREQVKEDHPKLYDIKVDLIQKKHQIGKLGNIFVRRGA